MIIDLLAELPKEAPDYLRFVRSLPCCGCGVRGQQHAHHRISDRYSSAKVADWYTLPLCGACHDELHRGDGGWPAWEAQHGSQWKHIGLTLGEAIRLGVLTFNPKQAKALA